VVLGHQRGEDPQLADGPKAGPVAAAGVLGDGRVVDREVAAGVGAAAASGDGDVVAERDVVEEQVAVGRDPAAGRTGRAAFDAHGTDDEGAGALVDDPLEVAGLADRGPVADDGERLGGGVVEVATDVGLLVGAALAAVQHVRLTGAEQDGVLLEVGVGIGEGLAQRGDAVVRHRVRGGGHGNGDDAGRGRGRADGDGRRAGDRRGRDEGGDRPPESMGAAVDAHGDPPGRAGGRWPSVREKRRAAT